LFEQFLWKVKLQAQQAIEGVENLAAEHAPMARWSA
jgi:hypothetical protein